MTVHNFSIHNTAYRSDNLPSYLRSPDNHHSSDVEGRLCSREFTMLPLHIFYTAGA